MGTQAPDVLGKGEDMDWFIADTHYHHKNIIRGLSEWPEGAGTRDFPDFASHDDWLVNYINDSVMPGDTLYHLGDCSFGGKDYIKEFRERLNVGKIHIILGNHDHHIQREADTPWFYGFESISYYKELHIPGKQVVLMHYPIQSWNLMDRGAVHLHGHVHGHINAMPGRYDVGIDAIGLLSADHVANLTPATEKRHGREVGGNKFGV